MQSISLFYFIGFIGFIGLFFGGDKLVEGSIITAKRFRISPHLIAVTIIALGTSAPELVVSVNSVLKDSPDLAWGNVVGSNIANLFLVIGGACIVTLYQNKDLADNDSSLQRDILFMTLATFAVVFFGYFFNGISTLVGIIFISFLLLIILYMSLKSSKSSKHSEQISETSSQLFNLIEYYFSKNLAGLFLTILGIVIVLISSECLIFSAVNISKIYGIQESLIGVTILALGTSLPEISTSISAVKKGHADIAIGNVLGSNLFNSLGILGASALASYPKTLSTPQNFYYFDLPIMLSITLILGGSLYFFRKINKYFGPILLVFYLIYIYLGYS